MIYIFYYNIVLNKYHVVLKICKVKSCKIVNMTNEVFYLPFRNVIISLEK